MRRSEQRILITHTGSLPRPLELTRLYARRARGEEVNAAELQAAGRAAMNAIVAKQAECGVDIGNNGEQQRDSFIFYIRDRLTRYRSGTYGPLAFGTSARSVQLTDWPEGGFIGIHGTDQPGLLPGRVSHGCISMRNRDILRLGRLMAVGTPVTIR